MSIINIGDYVYRKDGMPICYNETGGKKHKVLAILDNGYVIVDTENGMLVDEDELDIISNPDEYKAFKYCLENKLRPYYVRIDLLNVCNDFIYL